MNASKNEEISPIYLCAGDTVQTILRKKFPEMDVIISKEVKEDIIVISLKITK